VPFEGKARGSSKAQVTIVAFSDFQCPFCSRVLPTMDKLIKDYPDKVRVFFKHNPLPFHSDAPLAAQAAVAAEAQGKFWEMHDKLFANQQNIKRPDLEKYARSSARYGEVQEADIDSPATKKRVDDDLELGKKLGVQGTPNFFINGRPIRGAVPYEQFKSAVDDELARGKKLIAKGTSSGKVFAALMKGEGKGLGTPTPPAAPPRIPIGAEVYKVEPGTPRRWVARSPRSRSSSSRTSSARTARAPRARWTSCRSSTRTTCRSPSGTTRCPSTTTPCPPPSPPWPRPSRASSGRCTTSCSPTSRRWPPADLEKYASEIGLDMAKFKAAIDNPKTKAVVEADMKVATNFGVGGTPSFFINGHSFSGAYPLESFKTAIDEEIKKVDAKIAAGTPRAGLYAALIKEGLDKAAPKKEEARPGEPQAGEVYKAEVHGAPIKGAKDALVTIVQFSDFQCPFCSRVEPTIDQVMKEYAGKVRVAWRNMPLPFHDKAKPAAIAAMAANEQGKFWQMHDILFKNQQALGPDDLQKYAQEIGLNMPSSRPRSRTRSSPRDRSRRCHGRQDWRAWHAGLLRQRHLPVGRAAVRAVQGRIDEELKKAEELAKKAGGKAKVYDALMKTAKAEVGGGAPAPRRRRCGPRTSQEGRRRQCAGRAAPRTRPSPWCSSRTSSARSAGASSRRLPSSRSCIPARCAWRGRTTRFRSTTTPSPPPRPPWPPTSRASSGRCTRSCSRTSRRSPPPTSRSTPRTSASTWASSRPPSTATSSPPRSSRT
jgi:protein-disulfide isomerase